MKIHVINLPRSEDRRRSIQKQLDPLKVDYSFFRAVEGSAGFDHFQKYDKSKFLINTGRFASADEAGCYASHRSLWKHCIEIGEPILILEDDAEFQDNFLNCLEIADRMIGEAGYLRFQSDGPELRGKRTPVEMKDGVVLNRYVKYPFGALAYAVSPQAAKRLVSRSKVLDVPVDYMIKRYWEHGQPLFGFSSPPIEGKPLASTINNRAKEAPSARLRIARWVNQAKAALHRSSFNQALKEHYSSPQKKEFPRLSTADRSIMRRGVERQQSSR